MINSRLNKNQVELAEDLAKTIQDLADAPIDLAELLQPATFKAFADKLQTELTDRHQEWIKTWVPKK